MFLPLSNPPLPQATPDHRRVLFQGLLCKLQGGPRVQQPKQEVSLKRVL